MACVWLFAAGCLAAILALAASAAEVQRLRAISGVGDAELSGQLWLLAFALAGVAVLVSAVPTRAARRIVAAVALGLVGLSAAAGGAGLAVGAGPAGCTGLTLDAEAWRAARSSPLFEGRRALADELVRCRRLAGLSRREVAALLGARGDRREWVYAVGDGTWRPTRLTVAFDRRGRVADAAVERATFD